MTKRKKFKLTDETITHQGVTLHRIEALKDFDNIKRGEKGGFIEKEENLSHDGYCWVDENAKVYGDAKVFDDALVYNNAKVYGNSEVCIAAKVYGNAKVYDDARIYGDARVYGNAKVYDAAEVFDTAEVFEYAKVSYNAKVYHDAEIFGDAEICDAAEVCDAAKVYGNARIYDDAQVYGNAQVYDDTKVYGNAEVFGNARIFGYAKIRSAIVEYNYDYIVFKNFWSSGRYFTWTRSNNMWSVGCFHGTGEELIKKAYKDSIMSGREYERVVKYVEDILNESKRDIKPY